MVQKERNYLIEKHCITSPCLFQPDPSSRHSCGINVSSRSEVYPEKLTAQKSLKGDTLLIVRTFFLHDARYNFLKERGFQV